MREDIDHIGNQVPSFPFVGIERLDGAGGFAKG